MTSPQPPCPRCSSDRIKRSHSRNIVEKLLKMFGIHAYRCINCGWRGFRYGKESRQRSRAKYSLLQILLIVFALALTVMAILYYLSREEPQETFGTNVGGKVNLFEAVRKTPSVKVLVNITSDKCYENREWVWGYRENDPRCSSV